MTDGPAFALLHGGGQGGWVWDDVVPALQARGARVLVLDVPGCGAKRHRETIELTVEEVADELLGDIAAAGLTDVVLVGHSQAGTMLPVMWARHHGSLRRLVYLAACAPAPGQSVLDLMGRGLHGQNPDEVGWPLDPDTHDRDEIRLLTLCNDMTPPEAAAFLPRLDQDSWPLGVTYAVHWRYDHLAAAPASYIVCERDGILPVVWQERFAARLQVGRVVRLDAGHQAMNTRPEELAALLMAEATGADAAR